MGFISMFSYTGNFCVMFGVSTSMEIHFVCDLAPHHK